MTTVRNPGATPAEPPGEARPRLAPTPVRVTPETELTLLLDVGSAWTKAALVGRAGGRWRIVSGTAQPTAWGESVLVEDLVGRLTPHADARLARRLANLVREAPRITCRSPRRAGRLAVVGDTTAAVESATAVAIRSGWTVEASVGGDDRRSDAERFTLLRGVEVDAWLAVPSGGHGDRLWGLMAGARGPSSAPVVVVAAHDQADRFTSLFGTGTRVISSAIDDRLAEALFDRLTAMNGLGQPRSATPVAFGRAMEAVARGLGLTVLGIDAGSSWLAWHHATGRATGRTAVIAATPDQPLPQGSRAAAEILPADVDEFTTTDAMASLAARRSAIPASPVEAAIAQAIGIDRLAAARRWLGGCPPVDLLVGGGRLLAGSSHPADAAMILLDGLRPRGITQLALDPWGICGPLGGLPDAEIDEALETLRDDLLMPLGTAVVSRGGQSGQVAFRARLHRPGWPDSTAVEVRAGSMTVLPLERGAAGELEIELERGVHVGPAVRGQRLRASVTGGAVGIVLDARDDPIQLPSRPGDARSMIQTWRDALRRETRPGGTG
jgi:hypothetical protein